jgi:hypothetical protein
MQDSLCSNVMTWWKNWNFHVTPNNGSFIGASKLSFRAILLYNGNAKPLVVIAYSVANKKLYENTSM